MRGTICGHDRVVLTRVLRNRFDATMTRFSSLDEERADDDCHDPAKLAEMLAELLQQLGVFVFACDDPGDDMRFPAVEVVVDNGAIGFHAYLIWKGCEDEPSSIARPLSQARALALRLLELPEGATAEDAMKAMGAK